VTTAIASAPGPRGLRPRLLTVLCYGAMMCLAIGINLVPVLLTTLSGALGGPAGLTQEQLGRLGAAAFAGLVLGIVITGPLADRWGAKPFTLVGLGVVALSLVGLASAHDYVTAGVAVFLLGLGAGQIDMVLSPVVAALNPQRRASAMNWLHSFYCVGAMVTVLAGTTVLWLGVDWRSACLVQVPLPLLLIAAFAPLRFPSMVADSGRVPFRALLRQRWFLAALAAIFLGGATELGMAQWLPAYAETALGYPAWMGGAALLAFSLAMTIGRMVVGILATRWNPFHLMAWSCASSVVFFLAGAFVPHPAIALGCCVAAGFSGSCLWPTTLAVTADRYPNGGASMFGALAALGNAGGILMPWVVGWVADHRDLHWGLALSALAPLAMMPLVLWLNAHRRSVWSDG
jgi:fucose permease